MSSLTYIQNYIKRDVSLKNLVGFGSGGNCDYFFEPDSVDNDGAEADDLTGDIGDVDLPVKKIIPAPATAPVPAVRDKNPDGWRFRERYQRTATE